MTCSSIQKEARACYQLWQLYSKYIYKKNPYSRIYPAKHKTKTEAFNLMNSHCSIYNYPCSLWTHKDIIQKKIIGHTTGLWLVEL